jgi:hypothetical protein
MMPHDSAVAVVEDICTIAFYFLLRVGEYTVSSPGKRCWTVKFQVRDVIFWRNGSIIPNTAPFETLLQADGVHLTINNQKNGDQGSVLFHSVVDNITCPVKALVM